VLIREGGIIRGRLNVRRESASSTEDSRASRRTPSVTMRIPVPATSDAT
jgi:hypothetical protein